MVWYRVFLHGENFQILSDDGAEVRGFYTTRYVEATSPEEAEMAAVELIRGDDWLKSSVQNAQNDPPIIHMEEIEEVHAHQSSDAGKGYTFYCKDEA